MHKAAADGQRIHHSSHLPHDQGYAKQTWLALGIATVYAAHYLLTHLDIGILSPLEILWHTVVFLIPARLIVMMAKLSGREDVVDFSTSTSDAELRALKGEALRKILRLETNVPQGASEGRRASIAVVPLKPKAASDMPPGLGNWDNSCYQNSILQGLAALPSLATFLEKSSTLLGQVSVSTTTTLHNLTRDLTDGANNGKRLWTPAKLKSMSSWQQQDAQEYYSRVLDDVEKDLKGHASSAIKDLGLRAVSTLNQDEVHVAANLSTRHAFENSPLEGLLAQRVICRRCSSSEGLSLLPFNCLTVSLGSGSEYSLADRINEYTRAEDIEGVECLSCTFRDQERKLRKLCEPPEAATKEAAASSNAFAALSLPPELRQQVKLRLQKVEQAISDEDYTDEAVKRCAITKEQRVTSTKTKQVAIARAPQCLVIHINRSIFDEATGMLRKNMAYVFYPKMLCLTPWLLGQSDASSATLLDRNDANSSNPGPIYLLKAVVTHFGRHENGHYVCYREHDTTEVHEDGKVVNKEQWWRISDDAASKTSEEAVLRQSGVFMLFYEQVEAGHTTELAAKSTIPETAKTGETLELSAPLLEAQIESQQQPIDVEGVSKVDFPKEKLIPSVVRREPPAIGMTETTSSSAVDVVKQATSSTTPTMRTARGKRRNNKSAALSAALPAVTAQ